MPAHGTTRRAFLQRAGATALALSTLDLAFVDRVRAQALNAHFTRMFPSLPAFGAGQDPTAVLADLTLLSSPGNMNAPAAGADAPMVEPGGTDDTLFGAWFTYWGQGFICHDISYDQVPQPTAPVNVNSITDNESPLIDCSQVYGGGPLVIPALFKANKFVLETNSNGVLDVARNAAGSAIVADPRQDENFVTISMQVAMRAFHNAIVEQFNYPFAQAMELVIKYDQWITLHQWLPQIVGQDIVNGLLDGTLKRFYTPGLVPEYTSVPVEWSTAAMRLHPMVRNAYAVQLKTNGTQAFPNNRNQLFNGTGGQNGTNDLHGGRPLFETIDWGNFVNELARGNFNPANGTDSFLQAYKQIIPQLGASLFLMPIGQTGGLVTPTGSINLAFRDLVRGYFYGIPSGQAIAEQMGYTPIDPSELLQGLPTPVDPDTVPTLTTGTPLWLYILYEALANSTDPAPNGFDAYLQPRKKLDGSTTFGPYQLGPVGGRLLADFVLRLLEIDPNGILNPANLFTPEPPIAPAPGEFGFADLALFAGVATRP